MSLYLMVKGLIPKWSTSSSLISLSRRLFSYTPNVPQQNGNVEPSHETLASHPSGLYADLVTKVTNFHNEDKGYMVLAGDVFDVPIRKDLVHKVVPWQLANRQQGTHSTKTIGEVSGSGRKPWNQKGTGRASHGSL